MRGVQKCTCAGASLRGRNFALLCCIKLDMVTDYGVSGTSFEKRTEFQRMLADVQAGKFECLLVKNFSRFGRDLSRKVKSARKNRNEQGEYTASFTAFGYRKKPSDKHKLVVDEPAAEVVRKIFALAAGGKSAAEIARILNERKTPTRLQRQWERGINFKPKHNMGDYLWENTMVLAIIRNPIYKGTLIQNRYETVGFGE